MYTKDWIANLPNAKIITTFAPEALSWEICDETSGEVAVIALLAHDNLLLRAEPLFQPVQQFAAIPESW